MKILVGIPSIRSYGPFIESMNSFLPAISKFHEVEVYEVRNRTIAEARNMIADYFLSKDFEYLLFLDDDHSGHTVEMLEVLFNTNAMVSGIKCYRKDFPYLPNLLDYSGNSEELVKYRVKDETTGILECDLVGFGMTLIKREVFNLMSKPYFIGKENQKEDNYFCDKLRERGVKLMGCFDYCLPHQGIGEKEAKELYDQEIQKVMERIVKENPGIGHFNLSLIA